MLKVLYIFVQFIELSVQGLNVWLNFPDLAQTCAFSYFMYIKQSVERGYEHKILFSFLPFSFVYQIFTITWWKIAQ